MAMLPACIDTYREATPPEYDRLVAPDRAHFACCVDEHGIARELDAIGGEWKCIRGHRAPQGWTP